MEFQYFECGGNLGFVKISQKILNFASAIRTIHRNVQYTLTLTNGYRIQIPRTGYKLLISFMEKYTKPPYNFFIT